MDALDLAVSLDTHASLTPRGSSRLHRRSLSSAGSDSSLLDAPTSADNIQAFVRVQPTIDTRQCVEVDVDHNCITVAKCAADAKTFAVDGVLPATATQADVYDAVGAAFIQHALAGFNGCLFAYGQTGSGKTHTMEGDATTGNGRGVVPRLLEALFEQLAAEPGTYECRCSFLEIYNEKVYDLLDDATADAKPVREDSSRGVFVQDLLEVPIASAHNALQLLALGSRNRTVGSTAMNRESSRSHSVLTLKLSRTRSCDGLTATIKSTLHLVDLAGSEKQAHTGATGARLKEASQINKSLSVLGNVITALVDVSSGHRRHVHYRDSKLTFLLRDALGGNSKTTVVATISAQERWCHETLSTLQFVQRAKWIKNHAKKYEDDTAVIARLEREVAELRCQLQSSEPEGEAADYEETIAALKVKLATAASADVAGYERTISKLREELATKQATIIAQDKEIYSIKDTLGKIVKDTEIILDERNTLLAKAAAFENQNRASETATAKANRALREAQEELDAKEKAVTQASVAKSPQEDRKLSDLNPASEIERKLERRAVFEPPEPTSIELPVGGGENIRCMVRVRPMPESPISRRCIELDLPTQSITVGTHAKLPSDHRRFAVDGIFPEESSQEYVFTKVGLPVVEAVLQGYNGCIFAYGQTGSGKTHTMQGDMHGANRGLIPRLVDELFASLAAAQVEFTCHCSFLEIYNDKVFDLLDAGTTQPKAVREDGGVFVQGLIETPVAAPHEALALLQLGSKRRTVESTAMNRESSRSHSVFTLKLHQVVAAGGVCNRQSLVHLVDLAGSEKQSHTRAFGLRLKEAAQINKSLSVLGNVITALVDVSSGHRRHVNYRDSKLTFLLREALGGNSKTTLVATIAPEEAWSHETLSTLQFVQRAKSVCTAATPNDAPADSVADLQQRLAASVSALEALRGSSAEAQAALEARLDAIHRDRCRAIEDLARLQKQCRDQDQLLQQATARATMLIHDTNCTTGSTGTTDSRTTDDFEASGIAAMRAELERAGMQLVDLDGRTAATIEGLRNQLAAAEEAHRATTARLNEAETHLDAPEPLPLVQVPPQDDGWLLSLARAPAEIAQLRASKKFLQHALQAALSDNAALLQHARSLQAARATPPTPLQGFSKMSLDEQVKALAAEKVALATRLKAAQAKALALESDLKRTTYRRQPLLEPLSLADPTPINALVAALRSSQATLQSTVTDQMLSAELLATEVRLLKSQLALREE
ncbi:kinesin-like protein KIF15-A-like isoform X2 [Achlya hypogyna]|uniref:Kinesin-like protein KIF15-A-like isoform X2 n=1 Tax=Achlya hypogyna TaxID=1202772 RepID=A0A1V9YEX2_ACHHY|nr:kinesin-like protein KIF15-A-like isoform X2 [Achlya hypogyna]